VTAENRKSQEIDEAQAGEFRKCAYRGRLIPILILEVVFWGMPKLLNVEEVFERRTGVVMQAMLLWAYTYLLINVKFRRTFELLK
jgi:hypothetical protein